MATSSEPPAGPAPVDQPAVAPWVITRDTKGQMAFMADVLDAEILAVVEGPDGVVGHAEVRLGDSLILLFDTPAGWPGTPAFLRVWVTDCRRTVKRAVEAGAELVTEPTELFWGDRVARVRDPFGTLWWIQQHLADLAPPELQHRAEQPEFGDAMAYVQQTLLDHPPPQPGPTTRD